MYACVSLACRVQREWGHPQRVLWETWRVLHGARQVLTGATVGADGGTAGLVGRTAQRFCRGPQRVLSVGGSALFFQVAELSRGRAQRVLSGQGAACAVGGHSGCCRGHSGCCRGHGGCCRGHSVCCQWLSAVLLSGRGTVCVVGAEHGGTARRTSGTSSTTALRVLVFIPLARRWCGTSPPGWAALQAAMG